MIVISSISHFNRRFTIHLSIPENIRVIVFILKYYNIVYKLIHYRQFLTKKVIKLNLKTFQCTY